MTRTRGIAWKPTAIWIGLYDRLFWPYLHRNFYLRAFGDLVLDIGFCFGELRITLSEAWPFIRKE